MQHKRKKPGRKAKSIAELGAAQPKDPTEDPFGSIPKELLDLIEKDAGMGLSTDSRDFPSDPDRNAIDEEALMNTTVTTHALREIVATIVDGAPLDDWRPKRSKTGSSRSTKSFRTFRIEQAMKFLIGAAVPKGAPSLNHHIHALEVARLYRRQRWELENDNSKRLQDILTQVYWPNGPPPGKGDKELEDDTRPLKDYFLANLDELLMLDAGSGDPDFEDAILTIGRVISDLQYLGLATPPKK